MSSLPPPPYSPPPDEWRPEMPPEGRHDAHQQNRQPGTPPRRQGVVGWLTSAALAVFAVLKYGVLLVKVIPGLATLSTLALSFVLYAAFFGGVATAAGLVLMILVHEMGHVVEIRRQGLRATAPIFIPFLGAAIFQRSMPSDPIRQARIGIAGPIAGTIGATVAFVLYGSTHLELFLYWAWIGFYINLFNLIPVGMLDGGWILAPVSKWVQVFGFAIVIGLVVFAHLGFILLIFALLGLPMVWQRFKNPALEAYYKQSPASARYAMGGAWLFLTLYLGFATFQAHNLLPGLVR